MHIVLLSDLFPPYHKGGHEIRCKFIGDELQRRGHRLSVLTSRYGTAGGASFSEGGIFRVLHYVDMAQQGLLGSREQEWKLAVRGRLNYGIARNRVERLKPDVVYAGQTNGISLFTLKAIAALSIPIVHHIGTYVYAEYMRDCVLQPSVMKRLYRKCIFGFFRRSDPVFNNIIAVSTAMKKKHLEVGFSDEQVSVIPPRGVPSALIQEGPKKTGPTKEGSLKLLYLGRITRMKGVHHAVTAVHQLVSSMGVQGVTLEIMGDGDTEYIRELESLAADLGVSEQVRFRGNVAPDRILEEMRANDILLVPSLWDDPSPSVIIEAQSQGVPVVGSRIGGIPERIVHAQTGMLVAADNPAELAQAILELIDAPGLYEQISANGITQVRASYTHEGIVDQLENCLVNAVRQAGGTAQPAA